MHPNRLIKEDFPCVIVVSALDSSGGSGLQTDLKVLAGVNVHALPVLTAATLQTHGGVTQVRPVNEEDFRTSFRQAIVLSTSSRIVVKIGWINATLLSIIFEELISQVKPHEIVWDPIIATSSDHSIFPAAEMHACLLKYGIYVSVLTPNGDEFEQITAIAGENLKNLEAKLEYLTSLGVRSIYLKGGHDTYLSSRDTWCHQGVIRKIETELLPLNSSAVRGTGCALSSAIAAGIALGLPQTDAIIFAKSIFQSMLRASKPYRGKYILGSPSLPLTHQDFPHLSHATFTERLNFPPLEFISKSSDPTLYPIVDHVGALKELLPLGVKICQLRIKDMKTELLEEEIKSAITLARKYECALFINDYWQLAIKHGAYGVHLGQEDLESADLARIAHHGLRLGVSTHCYHEAALVKNIHPSYVALGPIFPTKLKHMPFPPQGVEVLKHWINIFSDVPIVAIGGFNLENVDTVLPFRPHMIAVVNDLFRPAGLVQCIREWQAKLGTRDPSCMACP